MDEECPGVEEAEECEVPAVQWTWVSLLVRLVQVVGDVLRALSNGAEGVADDLAMHANYRYSRRDMHEQAALEIEQLTEEQDG